MAITISFYDTFRRDVMKGNFDLSANTIKVALTTSSYTPNIDTHDFFDDITNEVTGTGYSAGGTTLGSLSVTANTTTDLGIFDAADASWPASTVTARYAIIYKSTGTASTSALIAYVDFGQDFTSAAGTFSLVWNASGIINL